MGEVFKIFVDTFNAYKIHAYTAKAQREAVEKFKSTQEDDEAVIIMDFSENYSTKAQEDVQAAFFAKKTNFDLHGSCKRWQK